MLRSEPGFVILSYTSQLMPKWEICGLPESLLQQRCPVLARFYSNLVTDDRSTTTPRMLCCIAFASRAPVGTRTLGHRTP